MARIVPAILTNDVLVLAEQLALIASLTDRVHIDIGDGQFIARQTVSIDEVLVGAPAIAIEFHLMVADPFACLGRACRRPSDTAIVHFEVVADDIPRLQSLWDDRYSLAVNPDTPISSLTGLEFVHRWLVMGVDPGAQHNPYHPETPSRLQELRRLFPHADISVDGGMNEQTIPAILAVGIENIIEGSALWQSGDPAGAFRRLEALAKSS